MITRALLMSGVVLATITPPAGAQSLTPDVPAGAAEFVAVTAENGTPAEREAVLELAAAGPDPGVPRCLGEASFERTAWAWIEAAPTDRVVQVDATPRDDPAGTSTLVPDLALYPQEPVMRPAADLSAPALCDGRELLGDDARGDGSSAVRGVLRAGRPALVQVGWRAGDPAVTVLATLRSSPRERDGELPDGDDPADAPRLPAGTITATGLGAATIGTGDPATPWCPAPATVWRRIAVPGPGSYAVAAGGAAATLAAFAGTPRVGADSGCADLADGPGLGVVATTAGDDLWVRIGTDELRGMPVAQLATAGPFADAPAAAGALPGLQQRLPQGAAARCTALPRPALTVSGSSLRKLSSARTRRLTGTLLQPCAADAPRARRVMVAIARRAGQRCRWLDGRRWSAKPSSCTKPRHGSRAAGLTRWTRTLPGRLGAGRYVLAVRVISQAPGAKRTRVTSTARHTFRITARQRRGTA